MRPPHPLLHRLRTAARRYAAWRFPEGIRPRHLLDRPVEIALLCAGVAAFVYHAPIERAVHAALPSLPWHPLAPVFTVVALLTAHMLCVDLLSIRRARRESQTEGHSPPR